jgi:rhodanese-related sulfurtransferase
VLTCLPRLPALSVAQVRRLLAAGAVVVDVRPVPDVAAGHIPGAVAIPLRAQFSTWLGWLVPADVPVIIARNPDQDPDDILWPALNIGYEHIVGELDGGTDAWTASGGPVATTRLVWPDQVDGPVLDVRQDSEFAGGHLPSADHVELGALPEHIAEVPARPSVVMCRHGDRALTAATLLERAGRRDIAVLVGGAEDWARATGRILEDGA